MLRMLISIYLSLKKQDSEKEICLQRQWCKASGLYVNAKMCDFFKK
jgi:hypothetical protein